MELFSVSFDEIIFLSDVHWGVKGDSIEWVDNICSYFNNFFIPLVKKEIESKKHPCVVIAGDYFENRQHLDINTMNCAIDAIENIVKLTDVYIMKGNHDIYKRKDTDISSLRIFENVKSECNKVYVINDLAELLISNKKVLLVSWVGDIQEENKIISKNKDNYDLMVFHTEISGMNYDNNKPIVNGINLSILNSCKVLSGHIHKRQEGKKGIYFGSPFHTSRSDIDNDKGVYIFEFNEDKIKRRFIVNDYSPKFLKLNFSDYGRNVERWNGVINNNYVDIIFDEEDVDKINISKFVDELQELKPKKIEIFITKKDYVVSDSSIDQISSEYVTEGSAIENVFNDSISNMDLTKTEIKKLNKINEEYIKRATEELSL